LNALCDKCGKEYEVELKTAKLQNGVEKNYFTCQHCGAEYIGFYTDKEIRSGQNYMKILYHKLRNTHNKKKRLLLINEIEVLEIRIKNGMNHLKQSLTK